jgi:hypothetical protein
MTNNKYILDEHGEPVAENDLIKWGQWITSNQGQRIVKQEKIGRSKVSTVFLLLNHNYARHGPPVLWETMVFGGSLSDEQDRCSGSREQAMAMHERMVRRVKRQQRKKSNA